MCGIAGCFSFEGTIDKKQFEKMVDIIEHRGPDDRGTYYDGGIALGHRRLAIIDLSADGHQPFFYKDRYVIVFNGEIYNYREIREELEEKGYQFKTNTDVEVLIASYDCYGKECVRHFNGMWAFAIYDKYQNELYCARDRFGIKPFYYYLDQNIFIFGSEIKQILCMLKSNPVVNEKRLLQFLICGDQDYTSETMFQNVMQLLGGHEILFNINSKEFEISCFYDLRERKQQKKSYRESCKEFKEAFENSIKLRLRADVPIGYCLSGGLDSSAIVSMANKLVEETGEELEQHAISSCFKDKAYDEQEYIDEVIKQTKIHSHRIFPDGAKLFDEVDKIIWHMDEPFGSTSIYAQWNVFREAKRNGLTVMLDGQGADEQLAGYSPFYGVVFADLLKRFRVIAFVKEFSAYKKLRASTEKHVNSMSILLAAIAAAYLPQKLHSIMSDRYWKSLNIPFTDQQLNLVRQGRNIYPMENSKKYVLDSMTCGMQALLHYEDRDSMAFSVESRVPFLDYQLVEKIYDMPFEYKIRKGISKAVLRDALDGILSDKIKNRYSKLGFATPEDKWINENYDFYRNELDKSCDALSPLLDKRTVLEWFDKNKGKVARGDFMVWRIICAGRWAKIFKVEMNGER